MGGLTMGFTAALESGLVDAWPPECRCAGRGRSSRTSDGKQPPVESTAGMSCVPSAARLARRTSPSTGGAAGGSGGGAGDTGSAAEE